MFGDAFTSRLSSFVGVIVFLGLFLVSLTGVSGTVTVVFDAAASAALAASLLAGVAFGAFSGV